MFLIKSKLGGDISRQDSLKGWSVL